VKIEGVVFGLSLFVYFYHYLPFALMSNRKRNIIINLLVQSC